MATLTRPNLIGLVLACTLLAGGRVWGQAAVPHAPVGLANQAPPNKDTVGDARPSSADCRRCHVAFNAAALTPLGESMKSNEFILHNESATWATGDVHAIAYASLSGPLGKQMEERLGYKVAESAKCLTCHSVDKSPGKPLEEKKPGDFFTGEGGVNCSACHGLGARWQQDHTQEPANVGDPLPWREKDPQYKYDHGMADLRNPAVKARLCASCHVGNPDEGKIITHDMYAAGHPPIPPFELANYMESEPKHWGYPTDSKLPYFKQFASKAKSPSDTWKTFRYFPDEKESYLARHVAAGAVAAMEAEAALLEHAATHPQKDGSPGFDYARFDCSSCHHDLKYPSARQARGYEDGPPGRAPLKYWNGALPEVIAKHAASASDLPDLKTWGGSYAKGWPELRKAAVARQLGDPEKVKAAAAVTRKWCNDYLQLQTDTAAPIYTPAYSKGLLAAITAAATSEKWSADTESALALGWAALAIRDDLKLPTDKGKLANLGKTIPMLVRLPEYSSAETKRPIPIEPKLKDRLTMFARFDPKEFIAALKALGE